MNTRARAQRWASPSIHCGRRATGRPTHGHAAGPTHPKERGMRAEVYRGPAVDRGGVDADGANPPRRGEPRRRLTRDTGEVEVRRVARDRGPEVVRPIVPPAVPAGPHEDDRAGRNDATLG